MDSTQAETYQQKREKAEAAVEANKALLPEMVDKSNKCAASHTGTTIHILQLTNM